MAKDFLAIPLAGVGVERIFSQGRDVIHYRRNRLKGSTIGDIMICKNHWKDLANSEDEESNSDKEEDYLKTTRRDWLAADESNISDTEEAGAPPLLIADNTQPMVNRQKRGLSTTAFYSNPKKPALYCK
jgi:hypothetical protein